MSAYGSPRQTLFRTRVSDALDKTFFAAIFLIGAAGIILAKLNTIVSPDIDPFIIAGAVIVIMIIYVAACLATRAVRIREDLVGDNVYYLGFLFTLVSLGFALWQIRDTDQERLIEELLANFGIALVSTIFGIFLRVLVNQLRQDPVEIEREVRLELIDASTRLKSDIHAAILHFNDLRHQMAQIVRESFEISIAQHSEALSKSSTATVDHLEELARKLSAALDQPVTLAVDAIEKSSAALKEQSTELTAQLRSAAQELRGASQSLSRSLSEAGKRANTATNTYTDKFEKAGDAAAQAMTDLTDSVAPIGAELRRLREAIAQTAAAADEAFRQIGIASSGHAKTLSDAAREITETSRRAAEDLKLLTAEVAQANQIATTLTSMLPPEQPSPADARETIGPAAGNSDATQTQAAVQPGPEEPTAPDRGFPESERDRVSPDGVLAASPPHAPVHPAGDRSPKQSHRPFWAGLFGRGSAERS